jgi:hypothetical protein
VREPGSGLGDVARSDRWRRCPGLARRLAITLVLPVAAAIGMASVAGYGAVSARLAHADWLWLLPALGAVIVGFAGYYLAYGGLYRVQHGLRPLRGTLFALAAAAFGGVMASCSGSVDRRALCAAGASDRDARVRIVALGAFEYGVLTVIVCPAAIAALALGRALPRPDVSWPWAIAPIPCAVLVLAVAHRLAPSLRERSGVSGAIGVAFDAALLTVALLRRPWRSGFAALGMGLFWAGDLVALWAATAAFGVRMDGLALIVGFATGMLLTRRSAPFGGAGLLLVALVPALWYGAGVPFAAAALGGAAYHLLTVWVPLPAAVLAHPDLLELAMGQAPARPRRAFRPRRRIAVR